MKRLLEIASNFLGFSPLSTLKVNINLLNRQRKSSSNWGNSIFNVGEDFLTMICISVTGIKFRMQNFPFLRRETDKIYFANH